MHTQQLIDKLYPAGTPGREIFISHSRSVADLALAIAEKLNLPIDPHEVYKAAMLHDIGICLTNAPSIGCNGTEPYIRHGMLGAELLRQNGFDEKYARVAERHTGSGLTAAEIKAQNLPLPQQDMLPETLLEKLVCYADKFYSKSGSADRKPLSRVIDSMRRHGSETLDRFMQLHNIFSTPLTSEN